jgi:hypothetical protein
MLTGLLASMLLLNASAYGDWNPPLNPDPSAILSEAQADTAAGRYADALARHVWFHENALKYAPGMVGVRTSFALSYWADLAAVYPPALIKLKAVRDEAGAAVRTGSNARKAFYDFAAINRVLKEQALTKELFLWLDVNNPVVARQDFDIAEPALVDAKEYHLCGKYLDPDHSLKQIVWLYRETAKIRPGLEEYAAELREHATKTFSNSVATLVALLVLNDRPVDADRIAAEATKELDDPEFQRELKRARQGEVPPPWP